MAEAQAGFGDWRPIHSAPRDGTRILVAVRRSEQGPGTADVARWARPHPQEEECWIASDSDAECVIIYSESDLGGWMPMPSPDAPQGGPKSGGTRPSDPDDYSI